MGKFDWGKFGSALATNVGNTGQQFFMNKMLQEEEDKRAHTKVKMDTWVDMLRSGGPSALDPEAFKKVLEEYGPEFTSSFGGGGMKGREREDDLAQKRKELEMQREINPPTPSAFAEKFKKFVEDPEGYAKFQQSGMKLEDVLRAKKLMNDMEEYEYKKGQRGKLPVSELGKFPGAKVGDTVDTVVGQSPQTQLPPKMIQELGETEGTIALLNDWKSVYDKGKKAGYTWVGPYSGIKGGIEEKFAGGQLEEGQPEFYAMEARVKNMVIQKITGAQLGEKEAERIMKEIPGRNMPSEVWEARWKMTLKNVERLDRIIANKLKAGGYNVPKKTKDLSSMSDEEIRARAMKALKKGK